jgi:DNA processing protein
MERDELAAWLRLTLSPGVGNAAARKLLAAFGLPTAIFTQSFTALSQVVGSALAANLVKPPAKLPALLDTTWRWLEGGSFDAASTADATPFSAQKKVEDGLVEVRQVLALGDANYPQGLLNMEDPPLLLYLLGTRVLEEKIATMPVGQAAIATKFVAFNLNTCIKNSVAVVGSRNATPQGLVNAHEFSQALGAAGVTVVSGMALGIDGAAHEGAIEGLKSAAGADSGQLATVAVVGTGLDRVYPKRHHGLAHAIARHGLIVSEYPLGTPPLAANFPKRNRLIAGLTQGTLVVEATLNSGSLITARLAAEQGKEVFAIPGSIHAGQSRGCHALIRQGAKLVETVQDILEELKLDFAINSVASTACPEGDSGTFDVENDLLEALGFDPVSLDALQARTGMDTPALQAKLMTLELEDRVARLPGGLFQRVVKA